MEHVTIPKLQNELFYDEDVELEIFSTREELEEFLARAKEDMSFKDYTLYQLLAVTGIRKGEALPYIGKYLRLASPNDSLAKFFKP